MSGTGWQEADGVGGSPHLQRVANSTVTRSQAAYRAYIAHGTACRECGEQRCVAADELWRAYRDARSDGEP